MTGTHNAVIKIEIRDVHEWSDFQKGDKVLCDYLKRDIHERLRDLGIPYNDIEIEVKIEKQ